MTDASLLAFASTGLVATGFASAAALKGWNGWLAVRRLELRSEARPANAPDVRELRRRIRRLEAIADGTER